MVLIAREHHAVIRDRGLTIESPAGGACLRVPVTDDPSAVGVGPDDVVLLAMKSQDTVAAIDSLAPVAPATTPVVCVQNGVENERVTLRRFGNVYGIPVMCPTLHLEPGVVRAYASPSPGSWTSGAGPEAAVRSSTSWPPRSESSTFALGPSMTLLAGSGALLTNLGNAIEALCGPRLRGDAR